MEMPATPAPIEPTADLRMFASTMRQMYVALVAEGFTVKEALAIISEVLRSSLGGKGT